MKISTRGRRKAREKTEATAPDEAPPARRSVEISNAGVRAGDTIVAFESFDIDHVLVAYLELIRCVRREGGTAHLQIRSVDIEGLSEFLHCTGAEVVNRLATLMGASRLREASMIARFVAGDELIDTGATELPTPEKLDETLGTGPDLDATWVGATAQD